MSLKFFELYYLDGVNTYSNSGETMRRFSYRRLDKFTYHIIDDEQELRAFILYWMQKEWEQDHEEFPDQDWTIEWLKILPKLEFKLRTIEMDKIHLRNDLMNYNNSSYYFAEHLKLRTGEMEETILRGSSIEPLLIYENTMELMDGYTRYMILKKYKQYKTYAYLAKLGDFENK